MRNRELLPLVGILLIVQVSTAQKLELVIPSGHTGPVLSASFSPDGKTLATHSPTSVKLWDVESGRMLYTIESARQRPIFSPDGQTLITRRQFSASVWDVKKATLLYNLTGHTGLIISVTYSPDGSRILTSSEDSTVRIWDASTGAKIRTLNIGVVGEADFSPDGLKVITSSNDKTIKLWDLQSGSVAINLKVHAPAGVFGIRIDSDHMGRVMSVSDSIRIWDIYKGKKLFAFATDNSGYVDARFSSDNKFVISVSVHRTASIWDAASGKLMRNLTNDGAQIAKFSPDTRFAITAGSDTVKVWNTKTGALVYTLIGHKGEVFDANFNLGMTRIVTTSRDQTVKLWDGTTGKLLQTLKGNEDHTEAARFCPDGNHVITAASDNILYSDSKLGMARTWNMKSGEIIHAYKGHLGGVTTAKYSPDEKYIITTSFDNTAKIWDALTGGLLHDLSKHKSEVISGSYSHNGKYIVTASQDKTAIVWDAQTGQTISILTGHADEVLDANFSPDDKQVVTASYDKTARIWDVMTGELLHTFLGHREGLNKATYSPDGKIVATASYDQTVGLWDVSGKAMVHVGGPCSHKRLFTLPNSLNPVFSPDGNRIATFSRDQTIRTWDASTGTLLSNIQSKGSYYTDIDWKRSRFLSVIGSKVNLMDFNSGETLVSWISIDRDDWVVQHPSGLFDASPKAMEKMYFVSGVDIVELKQLKARYYEPGLWKKVMSGEKLRNVVGFNSVELPPDIKIGLVDSKGNLPIELTNKGGGIGEVTLYINGKETIKDIRPSGAAADAATLNISVPVSVHKNLIPGTNNIIAVKAWNSGQWISSRGAFLDYNPPTKTKVNPVIHILVCGASNYAGTEIDLKYAAKDAEDIAKALTLGARRLFGTDRSFVYSLTTAKPPEYHPTKVNIARTFAKISSTSNASDVLVVYLAGHGINIGGAEGDFHYLTTEAFTANAEAYSDPAIRKQSTISSAELVELFKKVPAQKQLLMIDACASGKVVDNLMAKRDIESGTLKALDRMKDRTGMHIITGCAADAVSYEASRYGQGLMTYSLLEGMRGTALRDNKFVDAVKLFQYAQDRVPVLASGIGGIQSPQVFSPYGSQSFDFGELSSEEKSQIPLAKARPIFIRSNFIDELKLRDVIGLGKKMDESLNETSMRSGERSSLLFVDVSEYPDGCQLSGLYKQVEGKLTLRLNKVCEGKETTYVLEGADDKEIIRKIIDLVGR